MASNRRNSNGNLYRILVFPAWLLYLIFRKPVFQWIAVVALAVWLCVMLLSALSGPVKHRSHRKAEKKPASAKQSAPFMKTVKQRENDDLQPEEFLERRDIRDWYYGSGGDLLSNLIDDLNAQGHKSLIIHEDGTVCIRTGSDIKQVETIDGFPPRSTWDLLRTLLREDEIITQVAPDGLELAWQT